MAITVLSGFKVKSAEAIDSRLVLSKAEMLNINDNLMPDVYYAVCTNDSKMYVYNKYATPNAETGKFSLITKEVAAKVGALEGEIEVLNQEIKTVDEKVENIKALSQSEIEDIINN